MRALYTEEIRRIIFYRDLKVLFVVSRDSFVKIRNTLQKEKCRLHCVANCGLSRSLLPRLLCLLI